MGSMISSNYIPIMRNEELLQELIETTLRSTLSERIAHTVLR